MTGHNIFAHSPESVRGLRGIFLIIIIRYILSEYLQNKSAQTLCPVIIREILWNKAKSAVTEIMRQAYVQKNLYSRHLCKTNINRHTFMI